nr:MAG TPA: hypothetical protein [Caudoviricetes sp.]
MHYFSFSLSIPIATRCRIMLTINKAVRKPQKNSSTSSPF